MPYSSTSGKSWIQRYVPRLAKLCKNSSIMDIGTGAGGYSNLFRSRLKGMTFEGLEIWEPYITQFDLHSKYDKLYIEDAREFTPEKMYGITFLGDVLEHMTVEEAIAVYDKMLASSEFVLISIPIVKYPQGEYMGNPYQVHVKDDWTHSEVVVTFKHLALYYIEKEIGIYIGYNPELHTYDEAVETEKARIAVYGIFNNDQKYMDRFLNSVKGADEIVLGDIGSTDETNIIINRFKEANPDVNIHIYPIDSSPLRFDADRNKTLSFISNDIDLCISLNMSEYLMEGWKDHLRKNWELSCTKYFHRIRTYWPHGNASEYWEERIHSRNGYIWKYPVHEILDCNVAEKVKRLPDFWIIHKPE